MEEHQRILDDEEEEDDSQLADSISNIEGELNSGSSKPDDAKSRNSLHNLGSNPDLVNNDDVKSFGSVKRKSTRQLNGIEKPILEVVTVVKDGMGGTSQIKGVSIAEEVEMKSHQRSAKRDFDGKSSKSFARSLRSRKLGAAAT